MSTASAFIAMFDRMPELMQEAVEGLSVEDLAYRIDPGANTIAWLLWHLTRIEDDHVSGAAAALGRDEHAEQVYVAAGFAARFALPFPDDAHGYGHTDQEVGQVRAEGSLLVEYYDAVHAKTQAFLAGLDPDDEQNAAAWERAVDDWEGTTVTLLARVTSVANEVPQHVAQAALIRGVVERSS